MNRNHPKRTLLVVFVLILGHLVGAEQSAATIREKLHAKVLASVPPPAPALPADRKEETPPATPPIVMKSMIVSEAKLIQAVTAAIERAEQERRDEKFSPLKGGKIGTIVGMEVGSWWTPDGGVAFLRLNKTPTYRQTEAVKEKIKELVELSRIGEDSKR